MTKARLHSNWTLGETDCTDDSTVSGVILPEPGVNVQAQVEAAVNEVVSEPSEGEPENTRRRGERPVIPWPTTETTPASEFTTPYFFRMAFPCLFPYGKGINYKPASDMSFTA